MNVAAQIHVSVLISRQHIATLEYLRKQYTIFFPRSRLKAPRCPFPTCPEHQRFVLKFFG